MNTPLKGKYDYATKQSIISNVLGTIEEKENLRRDFSNEANEMTAWMTTNQKLIDERFSVIEGIELDDTIESATSYLEVLGKQDETVLAEFKEKLANLQEVTNQLEKVGVSEFEDNPYTVWNMASLRKEEESLNESLQARQEAFKTRHEEIKLVDEKMKTFAELATAFVELTSGLRSKFEASSGTVDEVIASIEEEWNGGAQLKEKMDELEKADAELVDMTITENRYTEKTLVELQTIHQKELIVWVETTLDLLKGTSRMVVEHHENVKQLVDWINEKLPIFLEYEFDNTLQGIMDMNTAFRKHRRDELPEKKRQYVRLSKLISTLGRQHEVVVTNLKSENKEQVKLYVPDEGYSDDNLTEIWTELIDAEKVYEKDLDVELRRQLALENLIQQFDHDAGEMMEWIVEADEFLSADEHENLGRRPPARHAMTLMKAYETEYDEHQEDLQKLKELGTRIAEEGYHDYKRIQLMWDDIVTGFAALKSAEKQGDLPPPSPAKTMSPAKRAKLEHSAEPVEAVPMEIAAETDDADPVEEPRGDEEMEEPKEEQEVQ